MKRSRALQKHDPLIGQPYIPGTERNPGIQVPHHLGPRYTRSRQPVPLPVLIALALAVPPTFPWPSPSLYFSPVKPNTGCYGSMYRFDVAGDTLCTCMRRACTSDRCRGGCRDMGRRRLSCSSPSLQRIHTHFLTTPVSHLTAPMSLCTPRSPHARCYPTPPSLHSSSSHPCNARSGSVRAKFQRNLPPRAMGAQVRVMLYPSSV